MIPCSTRALAAGVLALACLPGSASANETGLSGPPFAKMTLPGADFYQVSATTRTSNPIASVGQSSPFTGTLPAPPAGALVVEVIACWNYLLDGPAPAFDVVVINGQPVLGDLMGSGAPDLDWGKDRGATYVARHVGQHLVFGGLNEIADACDKPLGADPQALGAGMTLLVGYAVPGAPTRTLNVWAGYSSTESSSSGEARAALAMSTPYVAGEAHFFVNALDGEEGRKERLEINWIDAGGVFAGAGSADNPWRGAAGPAPHSNLYDFVDDDIALFMSHGADDLHVRTIRTAPASSPTDQIAHSFAALSFYTSCGEISVYCTPKVNSLGCTPTIAASGVPSAGAAGTAFIVFADDLLNNANGTLFYGYASQGSPFQGGTLCVAPPVRRTTLHSSGGTPGPSSDCTGSMAFDFNAWAASGADPMLTAGTTVYAQYWTRDPFDPFGTNLSAGISFRLCP